MIARPWEDGPCRGIIGIVLAGDGTERQGCGASKRGVNRWRGGIRSAPRGGDERKMSIDMTVPKT
jgi:hypothetical protein